MYLYNIHFFCLLVFLILFVCFFARGSGEGRVSVENSSSTFLRVSCSNLCIELIISRSNGIGGKCECWHVVS